MPVQSVGSGTYLSFTVNLDTNVAAKGLWLCIAQLPPRSNNDIEHDAACPRNVEVLREILATSEGELRPLLTRDAQPGQCPVLVCPEYAFGSGDWARIDELVAMFPGPLLLVAGFGQCPLKGLEGARTAASKNNVQIHCGWDEDPDRDGRPMNFGSVWAKTPGGSREVVLFGKNFLEARHEDANGVFRFDKLTEIVFNDLRLLPFICADAIQSPKAGVDSTVAQRLTRRIVGQHTPALCVGVLMQPSRQVSEEWIKAINGLVRDFGDAHAVLAIVNVAAPSYDTRHGGRRWRNLSGIYVSKHHCRNGQNHAQESTAYFDSPELMAWSIRSTLPQLAFGTVSLPPYASNGNLHPWNALPSVRGRYGIQCEHVPQIGKYERSGLQDELLLLSEVTGCEAAGGVLSFRHVRCCIQAYQPAEASAFVSHLLDGPLLPRPTLRCASDLCPGRLEALARCLSCLDAVMEGSAGAVEPEKKFHWAPPMSEVGEVIRFGKLRIPVALWWSIDNSTAEMLVELRRRGAAQTGSVLKVFGHGRDGDIPAEEWEAMCFDITRDSDLPVAVGETDLLYADLPTDNAASVSRFVKPGGFQPLVKLTQLRCEKAMEEFMDGYDDVVRIAQS